MLWLPAINRLCSYNSCGRCSWPSLSMPLLAYLTAVSQPQLNGTSADHVPGAGVRHLFCYQGRLLTLRPHPLRRALLWLFGQWNRDGAGP